MQHFTILGGGIGGLTLAIALQRIGIRADVYEAAPEIKPVGAGIVLAANAIRGYQRLGIAEKIIARGRLLPYFRVLDRHGRVISSADATKIGRQYGLHNFAIHRAALHDTLLQELDPRQVHTGYRAIGFTERPDGRLEVRFENGETIRTDHLVAADGLRSPIRRQLLPDSTPRYAGYTCWRAVVHAPAVNQCDATETWGPGRRFGVVPLDGDRYYYFACLNAAQNDPAMQAMTVDGLRRVFAGFHAPVEALLAATAPEELLWNDISDLAPIDRFAFGRVALLGDAAHATTPNLGQGACQAIEDAVVLADVLGQRAGDPETAFREYERRRLARTRFIVDTSRRLGRVAQIDQPWVAALRNWVLRRLPESVQERQLQTVLTVDF